MVAVSIGVHFAILRRPIEARFGQVVDQHDRVEGLRCASVDAGELGFILKVVGESSCLVAFECPEASIIQFVLPVSWLEYFQPG